MNQSDEPTVAGGQIVTRFPPSPTGMLHIGNARTALFNWAHARRHGGRFILRFEDTDRARSSVETERAIVDDLEWLGLDWDNQGDEPRQSQRLEIYNEHVHRLMEAGRAYEDEGAVRFGMPDAQIVFDDMVRGNVRTPAGQVEDFVIRKADGFPTYHLAVVVDDADMGVTHVIRGQDHLTNTTKHVALQQALGLPTPVYAHMSLTVNPDGSKMSKRDKAKAARAAVKTQGPQGREALGFRQMEGFEDFIAGKSDDLAVAVAVAKELGLPLPEIDVADFRSSGYLPEVIVNYIALLGWNPGGDVERFGPDPLGFLKKHFDPARLIKANASFDREKLLRFGSEAIAELPADDFCRRLYRHSERLRSAFDSEDDPRFVQFAEAYQPRSRTLNDPEQLGAFFFVNDVAYDQKAVDKVLLKNDGQGLDVLKELEPLLDRVEPWEADRLEAAVKEFAESKQIGMGKVAQPLRVAVSGGTVSPPIGVTLEILGRSEVRLRIRNCLQTAMLRREAASGGAS